MKQFLLLVGSAILLLSCGSNYKKSNAEIVIDSTVNAKVAAHDAENARKNDSIINAEAKLKAAAMQSELDRTNNNGNKTVTPAGDKTDSATHK